MSERQGVEIDYCPECRGVWLDKGELDKIIEKSAANETRLGQAGSAYVDPARPIQPDIDRRYDNDRRYEDDRKYDYDKRYDDTRRRKKKGFLGDFFDFD
jgi:Zn-finger nucleic acid-binding protein